ncbi:MAG: hydrogenase 4 subunit B [Acidibrevibacterium sp.]|uniref:hydrogenase 4 subunit B n=1 Tax=Acidibrevibacterium sp. TaxID=2606776 RepID=UPI003D06E85B
MIAALSGILVFLILGLIGALRGRGAHVIVYGVSLGIGVGLGIVALRALLGDTPETLVLPLGLPWVGAHFRLDALAGFFLLVVNLGSVGASLYGIGYGRHERDAARVLAFYPWFLAALNLVIIADDAFTFLFAWELMSLVSWALVLAHHHDKANLHAGFVYLVMATLSGLVLLLAFGLLAGENGGYAFALMRAVRPTPAIAGVVLILALLGTGAKAGVMPLHAWLPLAHPAAPSHVSALMSGVMTKVAIYAFVRIAFDLLGGASQWGAVLVLVLGGGTAGLGILYALMESDLKRLLAYSTVENVGIIFIGLGLAMAFQASGFAIGAALALTAALFHVFNHAIYKSLLFFGAGAVLNATGERDMERLGGLIHRLPQTSFAVLIGCAAIAALPPLNGFVSEWLTFQAILLRPALPQWGLKLMIPADGALLALTAALTGACFVKFFGIAFLGRPRSDAARDAIEVDHFSRAAMFGAALLCLLLGLFPGVLVDALAPVANMLLGAHLTGQMALPWLSLIPIAAMRSSYNGLLIFLFIVLATSLAILTIHRLASRAVRSVPAWDCGFPDQTAITQYTGASFAQPIRRVFAASLFRARETVFMPPPSDIAPARIEKMLSDPIWEALYAPLGRLVSRIADLMNPLQFLTIRRFLVFVFLALISLLLALALWQ